MAVVKDLCDTATWLNKGTVVEVGEASTVVDSYLDSVDN
jgi:ABC-type polysaccharide/polyol phosphate transport system ATPase subunit